MVIASDLSVLYGVLKTNVDYVYPFRLNHDFLNDSWCTCCVKLCIPGVFYLSSSFVSGRGWGVGKESLGDHVVYLK